MGLHPRFEFKAEGEYRADNNVLYLEFNAATKQLIITTQDRVSKETTTINLSEIDEFELTLLKSY